MKTRVVLLAFLAAALPAVLPLRAQTTVTYTNGGSDSNARWMASKYASSGGGSMPG